MNSVHVIDEQFVSIKRIQNEQKEWAEQNFPTAQAWMPLSGIVEEMGEWSESTSIHDWNDAIGDIAIYAMDFCSKKGWDAATLWRSSTESLNLVLKDPLSIAGRLHRAHLKQSQGIRKTEDHEAMGKFAMTQLFIWLRSLYYGDVVKDVFIPTWARVSKRDWTLNPDSAHDSSAAL